MYKFNVHLQEPQDGEEKAYVISFPEQGGMLAIPSSIWPELRKQIDTLAGISTWVPEIESKLICKRCGYEWPPRINTLPKRCPACQSRYWNKERRNKQGGEKM